MIKSKAKTYPYVFKRDLPHIQTEGKAYFVTFSTHERWHLPESVRALVLEHCLKDHQSKMMLHVMLHAAVVMPDHVHLLFTPLHDLEAKPYSLSEILGGIKGSSAHSINKGMKRKGNVWQSESFDHILRNDESMAEKAEYICNNPVRKGLVASVEDYPWLWREWVEDTIIKG